MIGNIEHYERTAERLFSFCLGVQVMERTEHAGMCKRCPWRLQRADTAACAMPRCVRVSVRLGPGGCWTYTPPRTRKKTDEG